MNADIYTPFRTKLGTLCTGPPDMTHSHFQFPIHPALNGEITGMLRLYVPTGTDQSEWEAKHWKPYEELVRKAGDEGAGLTGVSAGWCVEEVEKDGEKCDVFVIIAGWKNVEAQMEAGKKEEYQEVLKGLREGAKGSDMVSTTLFGRAFFYMRVLMGSMPVTCCICYIQMSNGEVRVEHKTTSGCINKNSISFSSSKRPIARRNLFHARL